MSLTASSLTLRYGDGDATLYAVRDVSLSLPDRGLFAIMGPSGSGKSSLLYLLSGLKRPTTGGIRFNGRPLETMPEWSRTRLRRDSFGFVFQQPFLLGYLTARENIAVGGRRSPSLWTEVDGLLDQLHLLHLAHRRPAHLSGGERQRIAVARAMVSRPAVIFADEPTASLDHANGHIVMNLLGSYRSKGLVLVVTHDAAMVEGADEVFHLEDGMLI